MLLLVLNQIQMPRTNVLKWLWVEILCKQKITEKSCLRYPPSYLVGLLTKRRELSFFQACPSTADFGSSRSPPPQLTQELKHGLSPPPHKLAAIPLKSNKAEWVKQVLKSGWNFSSRPLQSIWSWVHFLFKYLAPGDESPPSASTPFSQVLAFVLEEVMRTQALVQETRDIHQPMLRQWVPARSSQLVGVQLPGG